MLTNDEHPISWAMLMYELDDAYEHLGVIINQMSEDGRIDEDDFRIDLGHVFAHLNRAWNGRNDPQLAQNSQQKFARRSRFPSDLEPL